MNIARRFQLSEVYVFTGATPESNHYTGNFIIDISGENTSYSGINDGKTVISLRYQRLKDAEGKDIVRTHLRQMIVDKSLSSSAVSLDNQVNFNPKSDAEGNIKGFADPNKAISNLVNFSLEQNLNTGEGTAAFWQSTDSSFKDPAKGLSAKWTKGTSNSERYTGCIVGGASTNKGFRQAFSTKTALAIDGSAHPSHRITDTNGQAIPGALCLGNSCNSDGGSTSWEIPSFTNPDNSILANQWATRAMSTYSMRQCFGQDTQGLYQIDTSRSTDGAGYDLFSPEASPDLLNPKPTEPVSANGLLRLSL